MCPRPRSRLGDRSRKEPAWPVRGASITRRHLLHRLSVERPRVSGEYAIDGAPRGRTPALGCGLVVLVRPPGPAHAGPVAGLELPPLQHAGAGRGARHRRRRDRQGECAAATGRRWNPWRTCAGRRGGRLSNAAKGCAGSPWGSRGWGLPGRGPWRRRVLEGAGPLIACQHALLLVHDPVPVEDRAARVSGEEPRPSFRDTRSSQGPPGVATSGAPSRRPPALVPDDRATVGSVWPMAAPVA